MSRDAGERFADIIAAIERCRRYREHLGDQSAAVGIAVAGRAADEGPAQVRVHDVVRQVLDGLWRSEYPRIETGPS